jgi:hypothetical protein
MSGLFHAKWCSGIFFSVEMLDIYLKKIKYIAVKNGYDSSIVDRIVKKQKRKSPVHEITDNCKLAEKRFFSIEYNSSIQYTLKNA